MPPLLPRAAVSTRAPKLPVPVTDLIGRGELTSRPFRSTLDTLGEMISPPSIIYLLLRSGISLGDVVKMTEITKGLSAEQWRNAGFGKGPLGGK